MTRIFFLGSPWWGHVIPTLPLMRELISRGHSIVAFNDEKFRAVIESTGATFTPDVTTADSGRHPAMRTPDFVERAFECAAHALPVACRALEEGHPDFCVVDELALGGLYACESTGASFASSLITLPVPAHLPSALRTFHIEPGGAGMSLDLIRRMRAFRKMAGIPRALPDPLNHSPILSIVYTSRAFHPEAQLFDDRYVFIGASIDGPSAPVRKRFVVGRRKSLYVSMGTIFRNETGVYRTLIDAFRHEPLTVLLSLGGGDPTSLGGDIPGHYDVRPWFDQVSALSEVDAVVTHGGLGTISEALYFDRPMVVIPQGADQFRNALRVEDLGAGLAVEPGDSGPGRIRAAADRVLEDPSFVERARILGRTIRESGGYQRGADAVERVMGFSRPNPPPIPPRQSDGGSSLPR